MNRLAATIVLAVIGVAGCMVSRGPSQEQIQAQQEMMKQQMRAGTDQLEAQMRQMQAQMEAAQDPPPRATAAEGTGKDDAGQRAEQLRAAREQAKAAKQENDEIMRNLRKDPETAKALAESEREHKDFMRANPSGVQLQFNLGDREEASLGLEMVPALIGEQKLLEDPALLRYLNSVGMWVAQQCERPGLPWQFAVIDADAVNAFAVPGGYVFVTRGMLALLGTESELAGVLGHEIARVRRKTRWAMSATSVTLRPRARCATRETDRVQTCAACRRWRSGRSSSRQATARTGCKRDGWAA
ncbi:MAG: M48 family metalloprotease [Betaproteobacteria bacterium]|nr:M48 family metalloprotease [Betaproteobacteria bacterium]